MAARVLPCTRLFFFFIGLAKSFEVMVHYGVWFRLSIGVFVATYLHGVPWNDDLYLPLANTCV